MVVLLMSNSWAFKVYILIEIGSRGACLKILDVFSKQNIKVTTNVFVGIKEVPKAIELTHSGKCKESRSYLSTRKQLRTRRSPDQRWYKGVEDYY
jgi:hypothetical protein